LNLSTSACFAAAWFVFPHPASGTTSRGRATTTMSFFTVDHSLVWFAYQSNDSGVTFDFVIPGGDDTRVSSAWCVLAAVTVIPRPMPT
jgi:hypothetical protein